MRLTALILTIGFLQVSAHGSAQEITLKAENTSLENIFTAIQKQTGYKIFSNKEFFSDTHPVTVNVSKMKLEDFLQLILSNQSLTYEISEQNILIKRKINTDVQVEATLPPPIDIHGIVTDSIGNPLVGASVIIRGTKIGTSTDANGNFVLKGVKEKTVLLISYTGYITREVKVKNDTDYKIGLVHSTSQLDQVQIIAYGTTTPRFATGNVFTVTSDEIAQQPVSNPALALEGRVPGLTVTQNTGMPGTGFTIQIRGLSSVGLLDPPLYVVDGVPYTSSTIGASAIGLNVNLNFDILNPLNFINPLDIESIEILKDADATAIYGSRGANGVVLITTKKGKSGKTKVDINAYAGNASVAHFMNLLNTQQYLTMRHEAFANDGYAPDVNSAPDLLVWDTTKYTDWQKQLIGGNAQAMNAQVTVSGGNKNTQYLISGDYRKDGTVFPGDFSAQRGSTNLSLNNISDNQKFKININVNYLVDNSNLPSGDLTGYTVFLTPNNPSFLDPKGNLVWPPGVYGNPYASLKEHYTAKGSNLIGSGSIHYQLFPELELLADIGYNKTTLDETVANPQSAQNPAYGITTGNTTFSTNDIQSWNIEPQINWKKNVWGGKLSILVGSTFQQSIREGNTLAGYGYTNDALLQDINSAGQLYHLGSTYAQYRYNAIFGRINYNYQDRYIINLTGRRDGSSRFAPGSQFANFGAIGGAWIFTNESFIKDNLRFISSGKVRGSYGITGNDGIPDYGYVQLWRSQGSTFQGSPTLMPSTLSSPTYEWEQNRKLEFGLNLGFLNDRILAEVTWYENRSGNQLVGIPLPPSVGAASIQGNLPALVQNSGVEMTLNTINIRTASFSWTSSFNISFPRNVLLSYPGIENSAYANYYTVGRPLYAIKMFHFLNVDPKTGNYVFQDLNGNGSGTDYPQDLQSTKEIAPNYYGGLENSISYKGFRLDFLFQFVNQTGLSPILNVNNYGGPGGLKNQSTEVLNRWQKPGDEAEFQKYTTGGGNGYPTFSNWYYASNYGDNRIVDASFIRLKNVSLSYSFPDKWVKSATLSQASIYLQGQNLITITSYKGFDPESQQTGSLPPLRVITAGIHLTF